MKARVVIVQLIVIGLILLWLFSGNPKAMDVATFSKPLERMPSIETTHGIISISTLSIFILLTKTKKKLFGGTFGCSHEH